MDIKHVSEDGILVELSRDELAGIARLALAAAESEVAEDVPVQLIELSKSCQSALEQCQRAVVPEMARRMIEESLAADQAWQNQMMLSERGTNPQPVSFRRYDWPVTPR